MNQGNSLAKMSFNTFINADSIRKRIEKVVGVERGQRFITAITSAVNTNASLKECTPDSIFYAALLGETLNLSPSPQLGHYYIVSYNDKEKGKVAQFQLGYKGYIQLAIRSGYYKDIDVIEVREGEYKGRNKFTGKHQFEFIDDEDLRENKKIVGYMAYFEQLNGFYKVIYWTKDKMLRHADKYAPAFSLNAVDNKDPKKSKVSYQDYIDKKYPKQDEWKYSSFWYKDFEQMAFKTLIRQLISKWGIMSIEMQKAYENDQSIIYEDGSHEYVQKEDSKIIEIEEQQVQVAQMTNSENEERQISLDELQNNQ